MPRSIECCDVCTELSNLDSEDPSQKFPDLAPKRQRNIESKRNFRHDLLVRRLPVEIVSRIFVFVKGDIHSECVDGVALRGGREDHSLRIPVLLSRVCRTWRNIAISTPQLWTRLKFNVWNQLRDLELLEELLCRSGALPLSLVLEQNTRPGNLLEDDLDPVTNVIRSHSSRWILLDLEGFPEAIAHKLLHNLDNVPTSNLLQLHWRSLHLQLPIALRTPLRPYLLCLSEQALTSSRIPFQWDNLELLELSYPNITTIFNLVRQMPRLTTCILPCIETVYEPGLDPLPDTPIVVPSLKYLQAYFKTHDTIFFRHLTLPGLTALVCDFSGEGEDPVRDLSLEDIINFLARSQLDSDVLESFQLSFIVPSWPDHDPRLIELTALTQLSITFVDEDPIDPFLSQLSDISFLPHLRDLDILSRRMLASTWTLFCNLFRGDFDDTIKAAEGQDETCFQRRFYKRPLEKVTLLVVDDFPVPTIADEDYLVLQDVHREGVIVLQVHIQLQHGLRNLLSPKLADI